MHGSAATLIRWSSGPLTLVMLGLALQAVLVAPVRAEDQPLAQTRKAIFGAGCFWGVEKFFRKIPGVVETRVGYAGGTVDNPTYQQVCTGRTGHVEVVEVAYDPSKVGYRTLLATFFEWHDPTTPDQQGPDIGPQYRSVIFTTDAEQETAAHEAIETLGKSGLYEDPIVTEVLPAPRFWPAEDYHQRYLEKNPLGYCSHRRRTDKVGGMLGLQS
ncbi:MAG: Peptide methionine sulfoxide reductase MsrA [Candidatus Omnitrophica bacterium]|nr:Peptide methionine sulfoxide reductase MsrA [Candidatus Omnitrophota bacterium]